MARLHRIGVAVNPERVELADDLTARLRSAGHDVTTARPDQADRLGEAIDEFVAEAFDAVAAVGGDGTQRLAAERLAGTGIPLAIVPGGTVNLLARVLGVDDLEAAIDAIRSGATRTIDLGTLDDEVFALNASTGWDAAVIDAVHDGAKRFGRIGYTATGIKEWVRSTTGHVTVRLDGEPWYDGEAMTVLVLNVGQRGSASMHVAPAAELDDGRLDVVVLRRKSMIGLLRATWASLRRSPPPTDVAAARQATDIEVEWTRVVPVQRDGDECEPAARTTYRCRPAALQVVVPSP